MKPSLSIIMPCYKGAEFIGKSIETVAREISLFEKNYELIVVMDGFVDDGYERAKLKEQKYDNLRVLGYEKNKGKGFAIRYGLEVAQGDYVAFLDSDLDYHPKALSNFMEEIRGESAEIVIGNRKDKRSTFIYPFIRKVASWGFNFYVNMLFPELKVMDTQAGIKLMQRNTARKLFQSLRNQEGVDSFIFDICLLVVARRLRMKIIQVPCIFELKSSTIGTGQHFLKISYNMGREVWRFRRNLHRNLS